MEIHLSCPRCEETGFVELLDSEIICPHCNSVLQSPADAWDGDRLTRCLICSSTDLFVRKDFPQRLGVAIVVLGFAISCLTWFFYWTTLTFVVLFATALFDFVLYLIVGESVVCYRCHAEYRGIPKPEAYQAFSLDTHERYRQQAARLAASGEASGREASGREASGSEASGSEASGREASGREASGSEASGIRHQASGSEASGVRRQASGAVRKAGGEAPLQEHVDGLLILDVEGRAR